MESREEIKARKQLSTDGLIRVIQETFSRVKDLRPGLVEIPLVDALMSTFAMFSLKCPSLLAFEEERKNPNIPRIYRIGRVPSDTRMREILDRVDSAQIRPAFADVFCCVQREKLLEPFAYWNNCYLMSPDGTEYFSSDKIHCASCQEKHSQPGRTTYSHAAVAPVIINICGGRTAMAVPTAITFSRLIVTENAVAPEMSFDARGKMSQSLAVNGYGQSCNGNGGGGPIGERSSRCGPP